MPSLFHRQVSTSPVNDLSVAKLRALLPRRKRSDLSLTDPKGLLTRRSHVDLRPAAGEDKPTRIDAGVLDTKSRASSPPKDSLLDHPDAADSADAAAVPDSDPPAAAAPVTAAISTESRPSLVVATNLQPAGGSDPNGVFYDSPPVSRPASPLASTADADAAAAAAATAAAVASPTTTPPKARRPSAVSTSSTIGSPRRMSAVLHSPPMPLPIANLPTFAGVAANQSWGTLALEGGPRSPALSRQNSRQAGGPSTTAEFPFFSAATAAALSPGGDKSMSDAEALKATKTMPVMLRMPSQHVVVDDDGGDAGDDDDEDDDDATSEEAVGPSTAPPLISEPALPPSTRKRSAGMEALIEESASRPGSTEPRTPPQGYFISRGLRLVSESPRSGIQETPSSGADDASFVDSDSASLEEPPSATLLTPSTPVRPALYSHVSQSMINLPTPTSTARATPRARDGDLSRVVETPVAVAPVEAWALPPPTPSATNVHSWELRGPPPLKRRLSAGDADPPPPKYAITSFVHEGPLPKPREEEGKEHLPPYWCGVHIEGTLSRKMEFTSPGVQARDRGWKKHYFVLHGTALFVYKFDPTKVPLRQGEPYLTCDRRESEQYLHVHPAPDNHRPLPPYVPPPPPMNRVPSGTRRNTISLDTIQRGPIGGVLANARRGTLGSTPPRDTTPDNDAKVPELFQTPTHRRQSSGADSVASSTSSAPIASHLPFAHNHLVHVYSLQGAESGLAADYKKRLHCVRIRAEGQQFMLQTDTARQCVQWIEAFQAATNVAMDLDIRPMPIQQTLPRRRRRAAARRTDAAATASSATQADVPTSYDDTPEGNAAAVEAAERTAREQRDRERERMLAEDQAAESNGGFRT